MSEVKIKKHHKDKMLGKQNYKYYFEHTVTETDINGVEYTRVKDTFPLIGTKQELIAKRQESIASLQAEIDELNSL